MLSIVALLYRLALFLLPLFCAAEDKLGTTSVTLSDAFAQTHGDINKPIHSGALKLAIAAAVNECEHTSELSE